MIKGEKPMVWSASGALGLDADGVRQVLELHPVEWLGSNGGWQIRQICEEAELCFLTKEIKPFVP